MAQTVISESELKPKSPLYSRPFVIIGWIAMLIFACHAATHMVAAGDTWVAMACGRYFVDQGVSIVEPFSANSHKPGPTVETMKAYSKQLRTDLRLEEENRQKMRKAKGLAASVKEPLIYWWSDRCDNFGNWPGWLQSFTKWIHPTGWIDQNWLTHVLFYSIVPKSTYNPSDTFTSEALVYWKFALYILIVFCAYGVARLLGVNPILAAAFTCFAIFTGRSYFDIRPAGFSNLFVVLFILVLVLATYKNILYIWLIVPSTIIWANFHGGYIYVFIMMTIFIGLHILNLLPKIWTAILYNILAWAGYIYVVTSTNWKEMEIRYPEQKGPSITACVFLFFLLVVIDVFIIFFREKLVSIGKRGIYHSIGAAVAAFVAMILFNPFHLTNLTHTFIISISKHAEKWRNVNEWHPGFEWSNPVGTGYPFLILFVLFIGSLGFFIYSQQLVPKISASPKARLAGQPQLFNFLLKIFGFGAAIFLLWTTLLSFAFINYDGVSFLVFLLFACVILLSIFINVYFSTLVIPILLFAISVSLELRNPGLEGRYIYPFILIPSYCVMSILASIFSKKISLKAVDIAVIAIVAVLSFYLMSVIYNPFNLNVPSWSSLFSSPSAFFSCLSERIWAVTTNLWNLPVMWYPAFVKNAEPNGYDYYLFNTLYIVNIISAAAFLFFCRKDYFIPPKPEIQQPEPEKQQYKLPKIDIVLWAIAALTIYMALRSRRFIAIAALASAPVIALFIQQIICNVSASINFYKFNRLVVSSVSENLRTFLLVTAIVVTASLGIGWAWKFKYVYLDPWPMDYKFHSVFMRMSASDAKPFEAVKFIRDNKLSGNMMNYWTEGGFIAWGQKPDPNTGKTPLQLFMDGRAQAAYDPQAYDVWNDLMLGGQYAKSELMRGRKESDIDYKKAGLEVSETLREYKVWVVLMPHLEESARFFMQVIESNPDWILIYYDDRQKILIDKRHPRSRELFEGIITGKTIYPTESLRNLMLCYNKIYALQVTEADFKEGLEYAIKAYEQEPSQEPLEKIIAIAKMSKQLQPQVEKFCRGIVDDYEKNAELYKKKDGYHNVMLSAQIAAIYLAGIARDDPQRYALLARQIDIERKNFNETKRW